MKSSQLKTSQDADRVRLGKFGEAYAAAFLEQSGYRLVAANFSIPVGRNLRGTIINTEIDLIAYDGPTLCFVEVKTRKSNWFVPPQVNVDRRKQRQIARAARAYRRMLALENEASRYDVVTVVLPDDIEQSQGPQVELLKNYWREERFKKRHGGEFFYD